MGIQSGATSGFSQNWVILWTQLLSWYVQYMCVKLQHYTNSNLAEAMALQYPKYIRWAFWVIAEISIILTDLPEVIGFAIAINLFNSSHLRLQERRRTGPRCPGNRVLSGLP